MSDYLVRSARSIGPLLNMGLGMVPTAMEPFVSRRSTSDLPMFIVPLEELAPDGNPGSLKVWCIPTATWHAFPAGKFVAASSPLYSNYDLSPWLREQGRPTDCKIRANQTIKHRKIRERLKGVATNPIVVHDIDF